MALSFENPDVDRLARELAERTGESVEDAVMNAIRERLRRKQQASPSGPRLRDEIRAIAARCASLPVLDSRSPDEILGYDEDGLPR